MWSALLVALLTWASSFACLVTAQNASQSAGADMAGASVQLQQCLAEAATQLVDNIRTSANFSSREASIRNATWELAYLGRACFKANLTTIRPIRVLAPAIGSFPVWQRRAVEFEALTGIPVVLEPVSFFTNAVEIFLELQSSPIRDGWILDPSVTGNGCHSRQPVASGCSHAIQCFATSTTGFTATRQRDLLLCYFTRGLH
ncbi:hypothetical protein V8C86DRAFT_1700058 [Haematococcus lacustris]